jgi:protein-arginine kinase activator protein McsA
MLCEICKRSRATVHITGWRTADIITKRRETRESVEHHFCEKCASKQKQTNPLLNPLLKLGKSGRALKMKVLNVSAKAVEVKLIRGNGDHCEDRLVLYRSCIPKQYAVQDMEFELFVTEEDLKRMQAGGKR